MTASPELGGWLRQQREHRSWSRNEMARRLIRVAQVSGDAAMPAAEDVAAAVIRSSPPLRPAAKDGVNLSPSAYPIGLGAVTCQWLALTAGEFIDALTIAGMAAGLKERLTDPSR